MRQKKILVVDDDEMNLNIARMILERKLPCKVLTVDNGIDALEMLRAEQVSLVLLDIMMPEFDGM
ncbi:MAG: response regulator, partial [Selenomonadaceae bacterium]|nr:response regulator [Selenomonadaceae bacterium]